MTAFQAFVHSHIFQVTVAGALSGAVGAARADWQAFQAMTTPSQFAAYDWRVAAFRWFHGAIVGGVTGLTASGALRLMGAM